MTNTVTNILSRDEELALRKPIEDYVGKIQAEIDELREEGTNKVLEYSEEIEVLKRDKTVSYTHLTLPTTPYV